MDEYFVRQQHTASTELRRAAAHLIDMFGKAAQKVAESRARNAARASSADAERTWWQIAHTIRALQYDR